MTKTIMIPGKSKEKIPTIMPEYYVLQRAQDGKRVLLTEIDSEFRATTRIGAKGRLSAKEPADIKALLKKAGLDASDKEGWS